MGRTILLLGHEKVAGLAMAAMAVNLDLEPIIDEWSGYNPRNYGRRNRPAAIIADMDSAPGFEVEEFCQAQRQYFGEGLSILAATASRKFQSIARLLDAGVTDCMPLMPEEDLFGRKLGRWLESGVKTSGSGFEDEDDVPEGLRRLFVGGKTVLGDICRIYPGAVPRHAAFRRMAPPDAGWRGVILADAIDKYAVGRPGQYLRWSRLHLFRMPARDEFAVGEKVLLRRAGPPLVAAVDRSGAPAGPDVYSLVPAEGISAGFICCLLNSRLADFYFNRVLPPTASGHLKPDLLKRLPVPRPEGDVMTELSRAAVMLAHFGPNPRNWMDRERRDELQEQVEESVFSLYGADRSAREELTTLHF